MEKFAQELYKRWFGKDLIQIVEKEVVREVVKEVPAPLPPKTNGEKLYDFCMQFYNTDPTPKDEQPDEYACVHSLTTILHKFLPDFAVLTYTPTFLDSIRKDKRFREVTEFKKGNIIISPTGSGNGSIVGHTGVIGVGGKILSNSSATGLWFDKFDQVSWIERYSRAGDLSIHIFELI